ncbi:MAG: NUDIX hydrolase [Aerococcus sp.]|nr:NUDIX hydrolase [Aerococcus sp.]
MKFGEETISKETIFTGHLIQVEKHEIKTQAGNTAEREIVHHQPAVAIVAFNEAGEMAMVRQYRKAIERPILEIPAGLIEPNEDWLLAAQREFEEETTYRANRWEKLVGFYVSPGYLDEYLELYLATDLEKVANPRPQDEDEFLELEWLTLCECEEAIARGEICDAKTIWAVEYMKRRQLEDEARE